MTEILKLKSSSLQYAYELDVSSHEYLRMCESIFDDENPCLGLYTYKFEFMRMVHGYMSFAYNPHLIQDNPEAVSAIVIAHDAYLFGAEKTFPRLIEAAVDRCTLYGKAYEETQEEIHLASIADELAGESWIFISGLAKLTEALDLPGFVEALPSDTVIPQTAIIAMGSPIVEAVSGYRKAFHTLNVDAQHIVSKFYGDRYSERYFPYVIGSDGMSDEWKKHIN